ncbi:carbohydrate esterase family 3 protein [Metarhizium guizhouense ARSEF 977]|uniref:Carbohydrate esterase family 3 protein n=1 Tax=Metarhizium guizhouense (strain ARSEF 977) TaxID=1276136 RepID=A0A0B4G7Y9_METGA|nr:carbohydrate esterase family 3 protein [Metarhizium guizhouense ARSEF 977]
MSGTCSSMHSASSTLLRRFPRRPLTDCGLHRQRGGRTWTASTTQSPGLGSRRRIRLMPLGGSITYGSKSSDGNGYRMPLCKLLAADGHAVEMLGSRRAGTMAQNRHEGWRGFRIDQLQAKVVQSVSSFSPDVITFNAGSNDCRQQYEIDTAGRRVRHLLEGLWAASPRTTIVLSTLVRSADEKAEEAVSRVNEQIWGISEELVAAGRKLVMVDMHVEALGLEHLADGTHPNDEGYAEMARIWYDGIKEAELKGFLL